MTEQDTYREETAARVAVRHNLKSRVLPILQRYPNRLLVKRNMREAELAQPLRANGGLQRNVEVGAGVAAEAEEDRHDRLRVVEGDVHGN